MHDDSEVVISALNFEVCRAKKKNQEKTERLSNNLGQRGPNQQWHLDIPVVNYGHVRDWEI